MSNNPDQNPFSVGSNAVPPASFSPGPGEITEGDDTGGIIPYKNPKALIAYYLGIFSGFPLIGIPLGLAAFIFGIKGLRDRARNPVIKGSVHAWIGIGCGGFFFLFWTFITTITVIAIITNNR
jgi:hypothetical protein